jgi:NitT/TauT family transport system permease protein
MNNFARRIALPLATVIAVLGLWEAAVRAAHVPAYILPAPSQIASVFIGDLGSGPMWTNLGVTASETLLGFIAGSILGLALGVCIGEFPLVGDALYPIIVAFQAMPKVAIAPLLLVWFGFGLGSKVAIAALLAFFPLLVNTVLGLRASDPNQEELMKALAASRWQVFSMVRFRNALPSVFAGLELAMVFSVIGAIVGEFVGARAGIGYMIQQRNANVDIAGIFSLLVLLGIFGALLTYGVKIAADKIVFWTRRS